MKACIDSCMIECTLASPDIDGFNLIEDKIYLGYGYLYYEILIINTIVYKLNTHKKFHIWKLKGE